jgi:agmatine deiminase
MHTPLLDDFFSKGEHQKHQGTIIIFPERPDIWRCNATIAQKQIIEIANLLVTYEEVYFCIKPHLVHIVQNKLDSRIHILQMEYDDIWARDISPSFVTNGHKLRTVCWGFNSWGGEVDGAYFPWDKDAAFSRELSDALGIEKYSAEDIILEGGAVITDGDGTLLATKDVLLNSNRNPNITMPQIESYLKEYFSVEKVLWLDSGLLYDETGGHIDNVCSFVRPGELCLAWTDDESDPQYTVLHKAYSALNQLTDARSRSYRINKIPLPCAQYITKEEASTLAQSDLSRNRIAGFRLVPSYINYYLFNSCLLLPSFDSEYDSTTYELMKKYFPQREIIQMSSREFLLGGGGFHCILHEIPACEER